MLYVLSIIIVIVEIKFMHDSVPGRGVVVVAHGDVHRQAFICVLAVIVIFSIWVISTSIHGEIVGYIYIYII